MNTLTCKRCKKTAETTYDEYTRGNIEKETGWKCIYLESGLTWFCVDCTIFMLESVRPLARALARDGRNTTIGGILSLGIPRSLRFLMECPACGYTLCADSDMSEMYEACETGQTIRCPNDQEILKYVVVPPGIDIPPENRLS